MLSHSQDCTVQTEAVSRDSAILDWCPCNTVQRPHSMGKQTEGRTECEVHTQQTDSLCKYWSFAFDLCCVLVSVPWESNDKPFRLKRLKKDKGKERLGSHNLLQEKIEIQFHPLAKGTWIPMTICEKSISTTRAYSIRTEVSFSPSFGDVPLWMFLFELTLQMWSRYSPGLLLQWICEMKVDLS